MNKKPTKSRLLTLLNLLIHETDEENPITVTEITSRLSAVGFSTADRKTIYKDIEILQAHGIDIICNRKIQNQYFIGSREFDLPELALLADAVQAAKFISTNGIQPVRNIFCGQVR
ncbi:MAG: WYL domain-containing protein, partial [Oscillospiraceae bacterium]|nr:WYL domain-containing protein [Oscillospiraceae bacterium]